MSCRAPGRKRRLRSLPLPPATKAYQPRRELSPVPSCRKTASLFHLETQIAEAVASLNLQDDGIAGLQSLNGSAQLIHGSDGIVVQRMDHISGLQAGIRSNQVGGAAQNNHTGRNAKGTNLIADVGGEIGRENAQARDETSLRIGGVEELIHGVVLFDCRDVENLSLIATQDLHF